MTRPKPQALYSAEDEEVRAAMRAGIPDQDDERRQQLLMVVDYVDRKLHSLAAAGLDEITESHIPAARAELETLQQTLNETAGGLIAATEKLQILEAKLDDEGRETLNALATEIFQLCGFQDLSGQRLTKIEQSITGIEETVKSLGQDMTPGEPSDEQADDPEAHLLNGPQPIGEALSQEDIDALFES